MKTRIISAFGTAFLLVLILSSCQSSLEITDIWARPAIEGENSAAYFTIDNRSLTSDSLLSASSEIARSVELHESMMSDEGMGEHQQMQMVPQESVKVPLLRKIEFKPGGLHVMFIDLQQNLEVGEHFSLILEFEKAGQIVLDVPVVAP